MFRFKALVFFIFQFNQRFFTLFSYLMLAFIVIFKFKTKNRIQFIVIEMCNLIGCIFLYNSFSDLICIISFMNYSINLILTGVYSLPKCQFHSAYPVCCLSEILHFFLNGPISIFPWKIGSFEVILCIDLQNRVVKNPLLWCI